MTTWSQAQSWFMRILDGSSIADISRTDDVPYQRVSNAIGGVFALTNRRQDAPRVPHGPLSIPTFIRKHEAFYRSELLNQIALTSERIAKLATRKPNFLDFLGGGMAAQIVQFASPTVKGESRYLYEGDELAEWFSKQWTAEDFRARFTKIPQVTTKRIARIEAAMARAAAEEGKDW